VLLAVGGGIAAYKAPELVRALRKVGAEVRVVVTAHAREFVSTLSLQAVSGNAVGTSLFDPAYEKEIGHIELARWAEVVVVAPATANLLARIRMGLADDLVTTVLLATRAPLVLCPAMNTAMLESEAVRDHLAALSGRAGVTVIAPDQGELACGEVGAGRQPDPPVILAHAERAVSANEWRGRRVLVTAGPTREHFDPVRFLSNPSTGRMGYAVAEALFAAGADVTLVAGPTELPPPVGVVVERVRSARELLEAVMARQVDAVFMAAAVSDYRPTASVEHKVKKAAGGWTLEMERTEDVISTLSAAPIRPACLVGRRRGLRAPEAPREAP
jgi:phosphopantothenoylcysteine decarboxylase/phosphopantothenate--cysteine ligase